MLKNSKKAQCHLIIIVMQEITFAKASVKIFKVNIANKHVY